MAFGRLRGPWVQELKSSGGVVYSVQSMLPEAGGQSPGRVPGVTPWGLLPLWQFPTHAIHAVWLGPPFGVLLLARFPLTT